MKGIDKSMTREKALEVSRALDNIDGFETFMGEVDRAIINTEDFISLSPRFKQDLKMLMQVELLRLKKILEEL